MSLLRFKFLFVLIIGLFVSSCDDMELCFYEDDFGEIANRDSFYVYSAENSCFFNQSTAHSDSTQSYVVQKCIRETKLSTIKNTYIEELASYFNLIKDFGITVDAGATCSQADPYIANNVITPIKEDEQIEATNARQYIYTKCVEYCTDMCEEEGSVPDSKWTKANIKTGNNYLGIKLTTDSYIYITVSGNIVLSSDSTNSSSEYKTVGLNDVSYTNEIPGGDYLDLQIDYNTKNISLFNNDLNNLKARTVLNLRTINNDLKVDNTYKYLQPLYDNFKCNYSESDGNTLRSCSFNFSNEITDSTNNTKITSYYNNNYMFPIFDYTYQEYASDIINNITYIDPYDNNVVNNYQSITVWNEEQITYKNNQNNFEYLDSYILSKGANSIHFKVNKPTKLAIRYIGTTTNASGINCTFNVKDENNYKLGENNKVVNESVEYNNITYSATALNSTNNTNKWQVLKTSTGNEIIFNQFSTPSKQIESKIEVNLDVNNSNQDCSSGFLIKVIPLKDYEITKTGLLFFDFVDVNSSDVDIKYNIINPNALYKNGLINDEYKLSDFYEGGKIEYYGGSDESNAWRVIKSINSSDIANIDSNNFTSDILQKSIFVRDGQIIRFDYSNWLSFDNTNNRIAKTYDNINGINVDKAYSLHSYIKERPAYFCVGSKEEIFDIETECLSIGGEYKRMYVNNKTNIEGKCYIKNQECMVSNELLDDYDNIDDTKDSCKPDYIIPFNETVEYTTKLSDFWNMVYTSYKNSARQNCYETMINTIYELAKKCRTAINRDYDIYKGIVEDGVESYITASTLNELTDISNIAEEITNLNNFFYTVLKEGEDKDGKKIYTSKSPFYYFKKVCTPKSDGLCYTNEVPMCYDLTNYEGSTLNFINRTLNEDLINKTTDVENYGTMNTNDVLFNAKRISNFNASNGLIRNFIEDSTATNLDEDYLRLKYENSIYINESSVLGVYMLNTIDNSVNLGDLYKYFISYTHNSPILKLQSSVKETYKNGANLAVMIGENDKNYYSKSNGDIYYLRSDTNKEIVRESTDGSNNGNSFVNIVKYNNTNSLDTSTNYRFNEKGELIKDKATSVIGIDFKEFDIGKNYINSNNGSTKNLFFKIIDINNNVSDNSGKYKVVIKEINESESGIITYFRNFFNSILHFVDGTYMSLQKNDKNLVACTAETTEDGICYIYNEDDVSKNGDICTKESQYCYSACDLEGELLQTCESVYNGKGFVKTIYETFINDPLYIFMAKMLLVLSITWYGFGYFLGMSEFKQSEIIMKIIKICFIYFLISPSGWNFFNDFVIKFFKDCIDSVLFLIAGSFEVDLNSELSRAIQANNYSDKTLLFSGCFTNLEMIFSDTVFNKMLGLAFSSWVGLIYLYLVFSAVINYIVASFTAMILYLSAQVYMSLIFCFFPLVILFMFFEKTKGTFDNWLGLLIGFAGQLIFLVMTLSFFNLLIYNFIRNTFSYTVCWLPLINMNLGGIPLAAIQFWKIPGTTMSSTGLNTGNEAMPSFYSIITFYMVGVLMGKFITEMVSVGSGIFGGMSIKGQMASKITGGIETAGNFVKNQMKNTGKNFYKNMANRLGGSQIKEFGESQKKQLKERRDKRNEYFKNVDEKTKGSMEEYKKSDEFKNDIVKEAKNNEFEKVMSKNSEKKDREQKEKNDKIVEKKQDRAKNTEEFNTLNKDVGTLLQKKEAGPLTKEEEQDLEKKQKRLNFLRNNKLSNEEYQEYTKAKKSNDDINKRNNIREQHRQNLEAIQKGQTENATENDKQKAKEAMESESKLIEQNYKTLNDNEKHLAEEKGYKNVLHKKQTEFTRKHEVDSLMERYGEDITKSLQYKGIDEKRWKSMEQNQKREIAEEWGISRGLIKNDKKHN